MRQYLIDLLKRLEFLIPPPPRCHHVITFAQFGSDETEWQDRLALQINIDGVFQCFFLQDEDFAQPAEDIANEVAELVRKGSPAGTQFGVAMGQYLEV
jgi:hypothetical protein